jgi:hypothetical protein
MNDGDRLETFENRGVARRGVAGCLGYVLSFGESTRPYPEIPGWDTVTNARRSRRRLFWNSGTNIHNPTSFDWFVTAQNKGTASSSRVFVLFFPPHFSLLPDKFRSRIQGFQLSPDETQYSKFYVWYGTVGFVKLLLWSRQLSFGFFFF